jgi:hypothetical protein
MKIEGPPGAIFDVKAYTLSGKMAWHYENIKAGIPFCQKLHNYGTYLIYLSQSEGRNSNSALVVKVVR